MRQIYSIGGGKGGSGKSFISASLGVSLATQGKKVVLVDLDLGASNLHTFLGLRNPPQGLECFIDKSSKRLDEVALATTIPNLYLMKILDGSPVETIMERLRNYEEFNAHSRIMSRPSTDLKGEAE